ncbi:hypothetical protein Hanom_Chr03g00210591 [Helianthus anomalus]
MFFQEKETNFDPKHNICCVLNENLSQMEPVKPTLPFFDRARIKKHAMYVADPPAIHSIAMVGNEDKEVIMTEDLIRRVLVFADKAEGPTRYPKRMVKWCFFRIGY